MTIKNRKEKEAHFKLGVLPHIGDMVGKRPFEQLSIVKLCERMQVSKVTFYNVYFSSKEELLDYYFQVWCLKQAVELQGSPREGLAGTAFLVDKLCGLFTERPGIVRGWIYHFGHLPKTKKGFAISREEKKMLF